MSSCYQPAEHGCIFPHHVTSTPPDDGVKQYYEAEAFIAGKENVIAATNLLKVCYVIKLMFNQRLTLRLS
jgi:hypothetical protein